MGWSWRVLFVPAIPLPPSLLLQFFDESKKKAKVLSRNFKFVLRLLLMHVGHLNVSTCISSFPFSPVQFFVFPLCIHKPHAPHITPGFPTPDLHTPHGYFTFLLMSGSDVLLFLPGLPGLFPLNFVLFSFTELKTSISPSSFSSSSFVRDTFLLGSWDALSATLPPSSPATEVPS